MWCLVLLGTFENEYEVLIAVHPEAKVQIDMIGATLVRISKFLRNSSEATFNGEKWKKFLDDIKFETKILYRHMKGQALFDALLLQFSTVYGEMRDSLEANSVEANQEAAMQHELPELNDLLMHKRILNNMWILTKDPDVKNVLNRVTRTVKKVARRYRNLAMGKEDTELGGHTRRYRL